MVFVFEKMVISHKITKAKPLDTLLSKRLSVFSLKLMNDEFPETIP